MLRLVIQAKRRYKKNVKHKVKTSEEFDDSDGQSSVSHNDQDSDVSLSESDEEIDAAEIEEEWIEYIKRMKL